jgi:regulator of protease activity HflC (stomatin/prohibitin superfamily)
VKIQNPKFKKHIFGNVAVFSVIGTICLILLVYIFWMWGFCRFYVSPDKLAVITAKTGKPLPEKEILAEKGQKGVWKEVLGEGRYFLNPFLYEWEIRPIVRIDVGKIGVVTSKIGKELLEGEFLADTDQKGIQKIVLGPGKYRINPYGYEINIQDALQIPIGYVGVITSLSGEQTKEGEFAKLGQKGVLENVLQPGIYYLNPKQYKVDILEVGTNQISLLGSREHMPSHGEEEVLRTKTFENFQNKMVIGSKTVQDKLEQTQERQRMYKDSLQQAMPVQAEEYKSFRREDRAMPAAAPSLTPLIQFIEFPSKDGFDIRLDITVEFEFLPKDSAAIFMNYGDLFQVVEKIILPQILSISRLKGSGYGAKDYIVGEGREKFQEDLFLKLKETLGAKGIEIMSALIRNVLVPDEIRKPIQDASIAIETNLTNIEKQETTKKLAELNTELSLISQRKEQVQQETQKIKAEIKASQDKEVAEIQANTIKLAAEIEKQTAQVQAEKIRKIAKAESDVTRMVGLAEAEGFRLKVEAFGDPNSYSLFEFARDLPSDMKLIIAHTGSGTLWTDLDKAMAGQLGGMKILEMENK